MAVGSRPTPLVARRFKSGSSHLWPDDRVVYVDGCRPSYLSSNLSRAFMDREEVEEIASTAMEEKEVAVEEYDKGGKNYLIGLVLEKTSGQTNPSVISEILDEKVSEY